MLNYAFESDAVKNDTAWRKVKPFRNVDRPRTVTASKEQARALLTKIQYPLLGLASGALYTGQRLSELVRLRVGKAQDARELEPIASDPRNYRVYLARAMTEASEAVGIVPRVTVHDLRRSYGSLMLNSGAPIETIQQVLGHADTRMTRRTYAHLLQKTAATAVQQHPPSFTSEIALKGRRGRRNG